MKTKVPNKVSKLVLSVAILLLAFLLGWTVLFNNDDAAKTGTDVLASTSAQIVKGAQGDIGPVGPQGVQGLQGIQGLVGPLGPIGPQGVGFTGPTGSTGFTGATGSTGATGLAGEPGVAGAAGTPGLAGTAGDQGLQGEQGIQGPQGIQGIQGIQGETGLQGTAGVAGLSGSTLVTGTPVPSAAAPSRGVQVSAIASCAVGKFILGGGATITATNSEIDEVTLTSTYPSSTSAWTAVGTVIGTGFNGTETFTVTAYALCSL